MHSSGGKERVKLMFDWETATEAERMQHFVETFAHYQAHRQHRAAITQAARDDAFFICHRLEGDAKAAYGESQARYRYIDESDQALYMSQFTAWPERVF